MLYFGRCKENHKFLMLFNLFSGSAQRSDQQETDWEKPCSISRLTGKETGKCG